MTVEEEPAPTLPVRKRKTRLQLYDEQSRAAALAVDTRPPIPDTMPAPRLPTRPAGKRNEPLRQRGESSEAPRPTSRCASAIAPIALSVDAAAAAIGLSRTMVWELVRAGELPAKRVGTRRVLVTVEDLERFIAAQENYTS